MMTDDERLIYNKVYYEKNKEKLKQQARARYEKNRKNRIEQMKSYNKKKLNLSEDQKTIYLKKKQKHDFIKKISKQIVLDFN